MDLTKKIQKIKAFFNPTNISQIAKAQGFIKRERKITAFAFLKTILSASIHEFSSLTFLLSILYDENITISRQSLSDKINNSAVKFIKAIFEQLHKEFIKITGFECLSKSFSDIIIVDSSEIKLNKISTNFKGTQNGPRCKIQTIYKYFNQLFKVKITKVNKNDQGYTGYINSVYKNNLVLVDLGYFVLNSFKRIHQKKAYFISRYLRNTTIYNAEDGNRIVLDSLLKNSNGKIDIIVLLGKDKDKLRCRFVAHKLKGEVLNKRRKKILRDKKRDGKKAVKQVALMDYWSIYITNIEETSITAEQVHNLYRLRWQIELLFKVMKSKLYMGELKDTSSNKSLLMMYGKMITLLTGIILFNHYDDVSLYKAIDYYKKKIVDVIDELCKESFVLFDKICRKIERFAKKSSRKKRPSANQICGLQPALNP